MPQYNRNDLEIAARNQHFTRDTFEKVLRLKTILKEKTISSNQCWDDSMIPFFVFIECQNIGNNEDRKDDEFQDV